MPQDTGPMVFMYRADLFEQYGLHVPTTWDEYAALAAQVRQVAPNTYLGGYPDDASTFAAYAQPLGVDGGRPTARPGASTSTRPRPAGRRLLAAAS